VTIGANVNQSTANTGTCSYKLASERPCLFLNEIIPGQTAMTAPCDGTITRFRLNGVPKPNNRYQLRVIRKNADESFSGTATSAPVAVSTDGVNEYTTSLPISAGETIGLDFDESAEDRGLRWVETPGVGSLYFNAFPADGGSELGTGHSAIYYLYNADITCTPSNEFKVIKQKGTTLTLELASNGTVTATDAAKGKKKTLKPSSAAGGPGPVQLGLKLNSVAKKTLREKGKVTAKAVLSFTPTGGSASTQTRSFIIKKPKASKRH
jgi:hypothetical protein